LRAAPSIFVARLHNDFARCVEQEHVGDRRQALFNRFKAMRLRIGAPNTMKNSWLSVQFYSYVELSLNGTESGSQDPASISDRSMALKECFFGAVRCRTFISAATSKSLPRALPATGPDR
jgi:hypothetical protein